MSFALLFATTSIAAFVHAAAHLAADNMLLVFLQGLILTVAAVPSLICSSGTEYARSGIWFGLLKRRRDNQWKEGYYFEQEVRVPWF